MAVNRGARQGRGARGRARDHDAVEVGLGLDPLAQALEDPCRAVGDVSGERREMLCIRGRCGWAFAVD